MSAPKEKPNLIWRGLSAATGGFGRLTGLSGKNIKNAVTSSLAVKEASRGATEVIDIYQSLSPAARHAETFEAAVQRLGLDAEGVKAAYRYYYNRFMLFAFFAGIGIAMVAYWAIMGSVMGALATVGFLAICLASMAGASFRAYQIRKRNLMAFKVWLTRTDAWMPRSPEAARMNA